MIKYRLLFENGSWTETLNLEEAIAHGNYLTIEEPPIQTVSPVIAKKMYFLLALLQLHGIRTEQVVNAINQVPNEFLKEAMLIKFNTASIFEREDSGLNMLAPVFQLTFEDLDNVFNLANRLDPTPLIF